MAKLIIKTCMEGDLNHDNFAEIANELLLQDGKNGIGLIVFDCQYLVREINESGIDVEKLICKNITYNEWEYDGRILINKVDENLTSKSTKYTYSSQHLGKQLKNYMQCTIMDNLPIATLDMNDDHLIAIGKIFEKSINENYKGKYCIVDSPLMKNCSLDLVKIHNPLEECGKIPGLTIAYTYLGCIGSGSGIHSEDYLLPSMNFCYKGKLIILIVHALFF